MNELLRERLFSLLSDPTQATNEELQSAYECFTEQLKTISQSEQDYSETYRKLHFTRIEFKVLATLSQYGQGKKCT